MNHAFPTVKRLSGLFFAFALAAPFVDVNEAHPFLQMPLDKETSVCISCHSEAVSAGGGPPQVCHKGGCGHPIGVDYQALAAKNPALMPLDKLDKALLLIGNNIGCATCHMPFVDKESHLKLYEERKELLPSMRDPMLTVDNRESKLCAACHRK